MERKRCCVDRMAVFALIAGVLGTSAPAGAGIALPPPYYDIHELRQLERTYGPLDANYPDGSWGYDISNSGAVGAYTDWVDNPRPEGMPPNFPWPDAVFTIKAARWSDEHGDTTLPNASEPIHNPWGVPIDAGSTGAFGIDDSGTACGGSIRETAHELGGGYTTYTYSIVPTVWDTANPPDATDLDLPEGYVGGVANGISGSNVVGVLTHKTGSSDPNTAYGYTAFRHGGAYSYLDPLAGYDNSVARRVNSEGYTVGFCSTGMLPGGGKFTLWGPDSGAAYDLGPGAGDAFDINDAKAGTVLVGMKDGEAFMLTPQDPNGDGELVFYVDVDPEDPCNNANACIDMLGCLQADDVSAAYGINNHGWVVGASGDTTQYGGIVDGRACLWEPGSDTPVDLNTLIDPGLGWELVSANAINDRGCIVGNGYLDGKPRGFVICVPEPASAALFGAAALGWLRRRKRGHSRMA